MGSERAEIGRSYGFMHCHGVVNFDDVRTARVTMHWVSPLASERRQMGSIKPAHLDADKIHLIGNV